MSCSPAKALRENPRITTFACIRFWQGYHCNVLLKEELLQNPYRPFLIKPHYPNIPWKKLQAPLGSPKPSTPLNPKILNPQSPKGPRRNALLWTPYRSPRRTLIESLNPRGPDWRRDTSLRERSPREASPCTWGQRIRTRVTSLITIWLLLLLLIFQWYYQYYS